MFAHGETGILPGLLIFFLLYPIVIITLVAAFVGKRSSMLIVFDGIAIVIGGIGIVPLLHEAITVQGEAKDLFIAFSFFGFPLFAGIISLVKTLRNRSQRK